VAGSFAQAERKEHNGRLMIFGCRL
jgi:hypothetical protein